MNIGNEFLKSAITRSSYYKSLSEKAMDQLEEADLYFTPNLHSNSIAIIIQHMSGNMLSRWTNFLSEDGEKDWRSRDKEFNTEKHDRKELMEIWEKGWACFLDTLHSLTEDDLLKTIHIRREPLLVIDAINRQLAHYPHHAGQIVYIAKMIRGEKWKSLSIEKGKSDEFNEKYGKV
jgi:hypothetical protein